MYLLDLLSTVCLFLSFIIGLGVITPLAIDRYARMYGMGQIFNRSDAKNLLVFRIAAIVFILAIFTWIMSQAILVNLVKKKILAVANHYDAETSQIYVNDYVIQTGPDLIWSLKHMNNRDTSTTRRKPEVNYRLHIRIKNTVDSIALSLEPDALDKTKYAVFYDPYFITRNIGIGKIWTNALDR